MDSEANILPSTPDINFESGTAIGEARQCGEERQRAMASKMVETRYKIDKWTGVGNFALSCCQIRDKLTTQDQARALLEERPESMREDEWVDLCSRVCDQPMNDEDKAFMLSRSLPNSLEHLVQTLMDGKDQLSFDDVYSTFLLEDSRKMVGKTKATSTALTVERGRTRDRYGNGKAKSGSKG
ncbi:hypothetical protein R1flu_024679 [Riccia fluitans]|uniref:Uncharacterized protein n=1 Tax=Riccia fluitans TaxID=41844 RepID=A0ABD1XVR0_9MARC